VIERHAPAPLAPGAADRLYAATLGNPLALVELASVAPDLALGPGDAPLPLPTSLERAYGERIAALAPMSRGVLALAAAEDSGDLAVVDRAAATLGLDLAAIAAGERAGLVSISYGRLTFRHPITRSAAYRAVPPDERRRAHQAIAAALAERADPDRRAWHLAAAALGPDAEAAAALAGAARRARGRSAYATAATSFERAARLTAAESDQGLLLYAAAESAWLGGDARRTGRLLDEAGRACADPALRLEIDHLRGHVALRSGRAMDGHDILVAAAAAALEHDPGEAIVMLAEAADACAFAARPEPMLRAARRAWSLLETDAGERERFFATLAFGMALIYNGRGDEGADLLRDATHLLERSDALSGDPRLLSSAALGPLWLREATSRALVERAIDAARQQGALGALPFALWLSARDAATSDRLAVAEARYEEGIRLARETGQATSLCACLAGLACVEAREGRERACRTHAGEALALTADLGLGFFRIWALDALAELEAGLGAYEPAIGHLDEKERLLAERGIEDPDVSGVPELVEALLRLDRADEAARRLEPFAARAEAKAQPWALARLRRCRGLLAGPEELAEHFGAALRLHEQTPDRFEEARTRLCYGEGLRRTRRRVVARGELHRALEAFEVLGATPWAERATLELQATGEHARRRDASTLDQLTPRELQVALVLADGHTTRAAAAKLFLSPKTVDYHVRNVYRKLGIASRSDLSAALAGSASGAPDAMPEPPLETQVGS
jgi:DNA-binding CsgD family transcriptional regulator